MYPVGLKNTRILTNYAQKSPHKPGGSVREESDGDDDGKLERKLEGN